MSTLSSTPSSSSPSTPRAWKSLPVSRNELNLRVTLTCGQSFRWKEVAPDEWRGVIRDSIVTLRQSDDTLFHAFHPPKADEEECKVLLEDYFQLKIKISPLYEEWGATSHTLNTQFKNHGCGLRGVRLIRQDPVECLYSFICSSNNNIGRITKMVDTLSTSYGTSLGEIEGRNYFTFPTVEQLSKASEDFLRGAGFGYRAKFIVETTKQLQQNPQGWLHALRTANREDAQKSLTSLMGVGQKVADCVALFSLDKLDLVPVDTHIWAVAQKHMPSLRGKSLNPKLYKDIGDFFRERFGPLAGWAHTVLFAAELPAFQHMLVLPNKIKAEVDEKVVRKIESDNKENVEVVARSPLSKRRRTKK